MDFSGKSVKIYLSTPLTAINGYAVHAIKGKIVEKFEDGILVHIDSLEPKKDSKYLYSNVFIPTHKIDFIGVIP